MVLLQRELKAARKALKKSLKELDSAEADRSHLQRQVSKLSRTLQVSYPCCNFLVQVLGTSPWYHFLTQVLGTTVCLDFSVQLLGTSTWCHFLTYNFLAPLLNTTSWCHFSVQLLNLGPWYNFLVQAPEACSMQSQHQNVHYEHSIS